MFLQDFTIDPVRSTPKFDLKKINSAVKMIPKESMRLGDLGNLEKEFET
jgi:hypothetical protein